MNHAQSEMRLEGVEVAVAMKKFVPLCEAESSNQAVDGCANRDSAFSEEAVILRRYLRKVLTASV
jgi:hypothetical protein